MPIVVRANGVIVDATVVDINVLNGLEILSVTPGNVSLEIPSNGIITAMINAGAITSNELANGAIQNGNVAAGTLTGAKLVDGTLTPAELDRAYVEAVGAAVRIIGNEGRSPGGVIGTNTNLTLGGGCTLAIPNDGDYAVEVDVCITGGTQSESAFTAFYEVRNTAGVLFTEAGINFPTNVIGPWIWTKLVTPVQRNTTITLNPKVTNVNSARITYVTSAIRAWREL